MRSTRPGLAPRTSTVYWYSSSNSVEAAQFHSRRSHRCNSTASGGSDAAGGNWKARTPATRTSVSTVYSGGLGRDGDTQFLLASPSRRAVRSYCFVHGRQTGFRSPEFLADLAGKFCKLVLPPL